MDWQPRVAEGLLTKVVEDELVVLDRENEQIHRLNALSVFIVDQCDGLHSEQSIVDAIVERYDVERPVAAADAETTITQLRTLGILV
jgi:methyltransferase-like protein